MKKLGFTIEFGKNEEKEEKVNQDERAAEGMEALARLIDKNLAEAVKRGGLDFDSYVAALERIWDYVECMEYDMASELMYLLTMILDDDCRIVFESLVYQDEEAARCFLHYFGEYIADGYIIDKMFDEAFPEGVKDEDIGDLCEVLDEAYSQLKTTMKQGVNADEEDRCNSSM